MSSSAYEIFYKLQLTEFNFCYLGANLSFLDLAYADGVMCDAFGMLQPRENLPQRLWPFRAAILHD